MGWGGDNNVRGLLRHHDEGRVGVGWGGDTSVPGLLRHHVGGGGVGIISYVVYLRHHDEGHVVGGVRGGGVGIITYVAYCILSSSQSSSS